MWKSILIKINMLLASHAKTASVKILIRSSYSSISIRKAWTLITVKTSTNFRHHDSKASTLKRQEDNSKDHTSHRTVTKLQIKSNIKIRKEAVWLGLSTAMFQGTLGPTPALTMIFPSHFHKPQPLRATTLESMESYQKQIEDHKNHSSQSQAR